MIVVAHRYQGAEGIHGLTTVVDKKADCLVCGESQLTLDVDPLDTLASLVERL